MASLIVPSPTRSSARPARSARQGRAPSESRAGHPCRMPGGGGSLRFTRRGRVIILALLSALLLAAFSVGRVSSKASGSDRPTAAPTVVVHAGESLWSIARRSAPGSDPRLVVDRIVAANHLESATVRVGQRLVVPRG